MRAARGLQNRIAPPPPPGETEETHTPSILLIDDDPSVREFVGAILNDNDCTLEFAENGEEGLRRARELTPDLILLDVVMGELDGFEVCRRLRADRLLAEVPIIMTTGLGDRESRIRGLEAGADDFMSKPYDPMELRARVRTVLRLDRYRRLLRERERSDQLSGELSKTQAALINAQRVEALAMVTGGVAHDFNNILTVVGGNASLVLAEAALNPEQALAIREIEDAAERGGRLVRQLMALSRRRRPELKAVDVNRVVEDAAGMLRRVLGDDVDMSLELCNGPAPMLADPGMIEQVVLNLAVNARDAMPGGGTLTIRTDVVRIGEDDASGNKNARPGTFVMLTVTDTGAGIPAEVLPRIFEPFFSTKAPGRGTGLGLATVAAIVDRHDAWVEAQSSPGSGATFTVFLPYREPTTSTTEPLGESRDAAGGRETVLIVEDEDAVRTVMQRVLEKRGYDVRSAADALDIWNQDPGWTDLLIADLHLPGGMNGVCLSERLLTERPSLRVLVCSGSEPSGVPDRPGVRYLDKPFGVETLAHVVRACLDEGIPG